MVFRYTREAEVKVDSLLAKMKYAYGVLWVQACYVHFVNFEESYKLCKQFGIQYSHAIFTINK